MRQRGFTLVELLVALAIFAIISAIAVPMYTQYSVRTYQTEAQGDLMRCAGGMERLASANFTYQNALDTDDDGVGDTNTGDVTDNVCVPQSTRYTISVTAASADDFELSAAPVAGSAVDGEPTMTLDAAGNRGDWD